MASWKDRAQRNRQEIVKAKLSKREMMRLGQLTASGALIVRQGLSARAFGALSLTEKDPTLAAMPPSPPATPWKAPMPRLTVKTPVVPQDMLYGPPDGTAPIDGATKRINHQYFSYDRNTGAYGGGASGNFAPRKFYELTAKETKLRLHPDYGYTTMWAFDDVVPGPLIQAKYGEPILVRFRNHLPSVTKPQAFGIAEITTHLHNAHTPSESDGNPVNYFNSINDPILSPGTRIVQINQIGGPVSDDSVDPAAAPLYMRTLPDPDFNALLAKAAAARTRAWRSR
jgi:hypothetical protein